MRSCLKALSLLMFVFLNACASLMVTEHKVAGPESLTIAKGSSVKVNYAFADGIEKKIQDTLPPETFKKLLKEKVKTAFKSYQVKVSDNANTSLTVTIKEFEPGMGLLRFLFIGGHSFLGAKVELDSDGKRRVFELRKDGQKTGFGTWGDQTEDNIEYLADKLANVTVK
jgi:hypothetical protein